MKRPDKKTKTIAAELANELISRRGNITQIKKLRAKLRIPDSRSVQGKGNPDQESARQASSHKQSYYPEENIGIWKPEIRDGKKYYVRDIEFRNEFEMWAHKPIIRPKDEKFRIVLIGESVARGFLYDPEFNPAMVLEEMCKFAGVDTEVIDLARFDLQIDLLTRLLEKSIDLQPDAIIVFAGNNWVYGWYNNLTHFEKSQIRELSLLNDNYKSLTKYLIKRIDGIVNNFVEWLSKYSQKNRIPCFFVVPEFNLLDWNNDEMQNILLLPNQKLKEWLSFEKDVQNYLREKNFQKIIELCEKMIKINPRHPFAFRVFAECLLNENKSDEALNYLKKAHDTNMFLFLHHIPGVLSIVQDKLISMLDKKNIDYINLPKIFYDFLDCKPPDRTLFLDYCHLTSQGIKVAMYNIAKCLLEKIYSTHVPKEFINDTKFEPHSITSSYVHVMAAIHNVHRGAPSSEVLKYHCKKALEYNIGVKNIIKNYLVSSSNKNNWYVLKEFEELYDNKILMRYKLANPRQYKKKDVFFADAAISYCDTDEKNEIVNNQIKHHSAQDRKINLLEPYYCSKYHFRPNMDKTQDHFFPFYNSTNEFIFYTNIAFDVLLKLTFRTPMCNQETDMIKLNVNNRKIFSVNSSKTWRSEYFILRKNVLKFGKNILILDWSIPNLKQKTNAYYYDTMIGSNIICFGEIHSFYLYEIK